MTLQLELQSSDLDETDKLKTDHTTGTSTQNEGQNTEEQNSSLQEEDKDDNVSESSGENILTEPGNSLNEAAIVEEQFRQDETVISGHDQEVEKGEQTNDVNKSDTETDQPTNVENLIENVNESEPKSDYVEIVNSNREEVDKVQPGEKKSQPDHANKQSQSELSAVTDGSHYPNSKFEGSNLEWSWNESDDKLEQANNLAKEFVLDSTTVYNLTQLQQLQSNVAGKTVKLPIYN